MKTIFLKIGKKFMKLAGFKLVDFGRDPIEKKYVAYIFCNSESWEDYYYKKNNIKTYEKPNT